MGKLYICGTPIGNLEDVSIRLLRTLRKVDVIACEDTRHTIKLLNKYKIKNQLISYHEHSSKGKEDYILRLLMEGRDVALVSDAGMPAISDPGEDLVRRAIDLGIELEVVPGPSAFISALALSGMDTSAFVFAGFLPAKKGKKQEALRGLKNEKRTIALYEAPHRLLDTLEDIALIIGTDRRAAVARELTKKHEEVRRGTISELIEYFQQNTPRGEICIIIEKAPEKQEVSLEKVAQEIEALIETGINKKEAFKMKAKEYSIKKSDIYKYFIENK